MPAISDDDRKSMVATPELQFEERLIPNPLLGADEVFRTVRILQQRWVLFGTYWHGPMDDTNSEWRDVPCVKGA